MRLNRHGLLNPQIVSPKITEVLLVVEALEWSQAQVNEPYLGRIVGDEQTAEMGAAIVLVVRQSSIA